MSYNALRYALFTLCSYYCILVKANIAHFLANNFAAEYSHQNHQLPPSYATYPVALVPPQAPPAPPFPTQLVLTDLYAAPPLPPSQPEYGSAYLAPEPAPVAPTAPPSSAFTTHSPVAPVQPSTSTEFTLPEIVENRSAKNGGGSGDGGGGRFKFIPLQQNHQYLAPEPERPNYDAGYRPPNFDPSYFYPRPTHTSTTTSTTTERTPRPIVVIEPTDIPSSPQPIPLQPPASGGEDGYNYNAPAGPPFHLPTYAPSPPSTPAPFYLPPDGRSIESSVVGNALRLHVKEMRCMQYSDSDSESSRGGGAGGYFRAILKVDSFIGATPTVDNDSSDKRCELKLARSFVVADIAAGDFDKCGVHACGENGLCLRLRFPTIRGMRTSADGILTLHCKTQERVAVKMHALSMGVSNELQARSLGTYAHGGIQQPLRTHVELLRRTANGFTRQLDAQSAVLLGEELLVRAHVIAGDGWNYTKLTDVSIQRISPSGELINSIALITSHGCLNPAMQSICPQPPSYDPPLGHRLAFKAVMFQGMHSGDELVLSMRISACLERRDCHVDAGNCSAGSLWRRKRRNTSANEATNEMTGAAASVANEISRIAFRVLMPSKGDGELAMVRKETVDDEKAVEGNKATNVNGQISENNKSKVGVYQPELHEEGERSEFLMQISAIKIISAVGFVLLLICLGIFATLKLTR